MDPRSFRFLIRQLDTQKRHVQFLNIDFNKDSLIFFKFLGLTELMASPSLVDSPTIVKRELDDSIDRISAADSSQINDSTEDEEETDESTLAEYWRFFVCSF